MNKSFIKTIFLSMVLLGASGTSRLFCMQSEELKQQLADIDAAPADQIPWPNVTDFMRACQNGKPLIVDAVFALNEGVTQAADYLAVAAPEYVQVKKESEKKDAIAQTMMDHINAGNEQAVIALFEDKEISDGLIIDSIRAEYLPGQAVEFFQKDHFKAIFQAASLNGMSSIVKKNVYTAL